MSCYLTLLHPAVYESFSKSDQTICGFRKKWDKATAEIKKGDKLICYLKYMSRWIGVLEVVGERYTDDTPLFFDKTDPLCLRFEVKPVVWLPKEQCLPVISDALDLSFSVTDDSEDQMFTDLNKGDSRKLEEAFFKQIKEEKTFEIDENRYKQYITKRTKRQSWSFKLRRKIAYSDWFLDMLASTISTLLKIYHKTLKFEYDYHPEYKKLEFNKAIYACWHAREFILIPLYGQLNVCILSDVSWAAELITRILKRFGYLSARGSSKRGGSKALRELKKVVAQGYPTAVVVDGPTGPVYKSKPGILLLSRITGLPIVPSATSANRAWVLKNTWCQYIVPKPFARCVVVGGKPIWDATKKGSTMTTEDLDRELLKLMNDADKAMGLDKCL